MPDHPFSPSSSVVPPSVKAALDGFSEGVVLLTVEGRLLYANQAARDAVGGARMADLQARLAAAIGAAGPTTLAAQEKAAIVKALDANHWKLAETAKHLGISRTTLWRRLKAYGLYRDGRSKWAHTS
jgi:DNA-binding NtrC family response regulator